MVEALEGMNLGGSMAAAKSELLAAVEAAEKASGGDLNGSEKGWQVLTSKLKEIEKKYGLVDKGKVREEAIFEMYKQHIHQLRSTVRRTGSCMGRRAVADTCRELLLQRAAAHLMRYWSVSCSPLRRIVHRCWTT